MPKETEKLVENYVYQAESHLCQLEAVIQNMEDSVIIFDYNGKILTINNKATRILGYDNPEDCPGYLSQIQTDLQLHDLDGAAIPFEDWPSNRILRGEIVRNFEAAVSQISTGNIKYVSYNGTPVKTAENTPALAVMIIHDFSYREQLLRQLEQEQTRLQTVLDQMPSGVAIVEAPSGKVIFGNHQIIGDSRHSLLLEELYDRYKFFRSDGRPYPQQEWPLSRTIRLGETVSDEEVIFQPRNGGAFGHMLISSSPVLNHDGVIVAAVLVCTNTTKLKDVMTKAALANQLQQIIEFLPDAIFVVNRERKIIAWNRAKEIATGISKQDAIGKDTSFLTQLAYGATQLTLVDVILGDTQIDPALQIEENEDVFSTQLKLMTPDKRNVQLELKATLLKDDQGEIIGAIETTHDITRQMEMEGENIRIQKLESLGVLAGGIAHDFNNILAAILANLQLATIKLKKREDISKYLEGTIETTRKASDLTKQLLTFSKGGAPVKKSVSIHNLVKNTVLFALSGSKVKAEFHFPEEPWVVDVDEGQITQVINNLTINAKQAMPIGGILEIYIENVILEAPGKYTPGQYVRLTVKDHGIGIPAEIINQIFDPFFTTKKAGNGLGLSTSYSIIKKHNGYIEVESTPGIGTIFYIFLPASMVELAVKECRKEVAVSSEAKLLLMDDEDTIRNVGGEMLTCFGYRVTLARDGEEAVELYKKARDNGEPFDVVIMDLTVPGGLGGIETLAILRMIEPQIKAIVSSGYANDPVISDYQKYGFSGVVIKPYKFDELNMILNKVIDKNQLPLDLAY